MPESRETLEIARGYEVSGSLDRALLAYREAYASSDQPGLRAEALRHMADIHRTHCEWDRALEAARQSAEIADAANLVDELAEAVNAEAAVYHTRGDFGRASTFYRRILDMAVNDRVRGIAYQNLALVSQQSGQLKEAELFFRKSLECFRRAGYARGEAIALINYGRSRLEIEDSDSALPILRDAETRALHLGDLELLAMARLNYAEALVATRNDERAFEVICTALGHFDSTNNAYRRLECLRILGDIHLRGSETENAQRCYQMALEIAERIDARAELDLLHKRLARFSA